MSGPFAGVPTQFQNAVTATGLQLDQNFNTLTAYLNDPTNRNSYAAAGGSTNTLNITFAPPVVGGYTAGLAISWKWNVTNTGGVVVNANGLGNATLVNPDGSALQSGQGIVGSIGQAEYDGTQFIYLAPPSPTSKAQMQTATASASFITPALAQNHPSAAKAWAQVTATYGVAAGYNVSSIGVAGTGTVTIVFSNAMSSTVYPVVVSVDGGNRSGSVLTRTTTSFVMILQNNATGAALDTNFGFAVFGTLA